MKEWAQGTLIHCDHSVGSAVQLPLPRLTVKRLLCIMLLEVFLNSVYQNYKPILDMHILKVITFLAFPEYLLSFQFEEIAVTIGHLHTSENALRQCIQEYIEDSFFLVKKKNNKQGRGQRPWVVSRDRTHVICGFDDNE